jgi:hypothetical protein
MFRITRTQVERFEGVALATFEETMVARGAAMAPRLAANLGEEQMLVVIRAAIAQAARHGLTQKGPVALFVELTFLFGSGFDADVQLPWARECLEIAAAGDQMEAASTLYMASVEAEERIRGPESRYAEAALRRLAALLEEPLPLGSQPLTEVALAVMEHVHPEKFAFVGEPALRELIAAGEVEAARHGLDELPDVLLLVALMFTLGQRCADDPMYPWIAGALYSGATPPQRARQLAATAPTWLRQVLITT